jgi:hypothetical protein
LGELHHIAGKIEKALRYYDESENLLTSASLKASFTLKNRFRIKAKLAYIYWLLGNEFINISVNQIKEANKIFNETKIKDKNAPNADKNATNADKNATFDQKDETSLLNNLCWYSLEKYIINKTKLDKAKYDKAEYDIDNEEMQNRLKKLEELATVADKAYAAANEHFMRLKSYVEKGPANNNILDTMAWFCYHTYLKDKENNHDHLEKAKEYCNKFENKGENKATFELMSINIQRNHIAEIMTTK